MKKIALVFPGQGSQSVGMLADLFSEKVVNDTFLEANDALGYDLKDIVLNGPESELNKTEITQPAILTASIAAMRLLKEKSSFEIGACAGHSLGEYSALVCADVIAFQDAVKLVQLRGKAMQNAVAIGTGSMAAIVGLEDDVIIEGCKEVSSEDCKVWAANFNSKGQVVISGHKEAVVKACALLKEKGAKRALELSVSAPSHCPLMQSAADTLKDALDKIELNDAKIDVYVNAYAKALRSKDDIKNALIEQLIGAVHWVSTIENMHSAGFDTFIEVGPNKVLTGLNKRIVKGITCANVYDMASLNQTLELL